MRYVNTFWINIQETILLKINALFLLEMHKYVCFLVLRAVIEINQYKTGQTCTFCVFLLTKFINTTKYKFIKGAISVKHARTFFTALRRVTECYERKGVTV